jgi:hypothetical protein
MRKNRGQSGKNRGQNEKNRGQMRKNHGQMRKIAKKPQKTAVFQSHAVFSAENRVRFLSGNPIS